VRTPPAALLPTVTVRASDSCNTERAIPLLLPAMGKVTFRNLTGDLVARLDVVIRFLAVLELFKAGLIELEYSKSVRIYE